MRIAPFLGGTERGLRIRGDGKGAWRAVDLSNATDVVLRLGYRRKNMGTNDYLRIEVSSDGGNTWTEVGRLRGPATDHDVQSMVLDLSDYATAVTMIRLVSGPSFTRRSTVYIDYVQIEYTYTGDVAEVQSLPAEETEPAPASSDSSIIDTTNLASTYVQAIGADQLWNVSPYLQGQDITVAVVDSGIARHPDLDDTTNNSRILRKVFFSQSTEYIPDDYYGHGTHVAGTIAGNGAESNGTFVGVAPRANLVDIQVMDDQGMGTMSSVVNGLQWVLENKDVYNIRVVNLSLNSSVAESYHVSPLDAAVEILWFNQIVVVVSAGNNGAGDDNGVLYPPANDPFVITVGAADDRGTPDVQDDVLAPFSAFGTTEAGFSKPEIVAPGTNIISLLASDDSNLALEHPDHRVDPPYDSLYFRMSGTSMASAVAAGAVALLLQDEPELTPDQVKYRLMATARPFNYGNGAGYLDIAAAVWGTTTQSANTGIPASQLLWTGPGSPTWDGDTWDSVNWNSVNWNSVNWDSANWNSVNWNSVNWSD